MESNWEKVEIGKYAKIQGGFAFKSKDFKECGVPVAKIKNIKHREVDLTDCGFVEKELAEKVQNFFVRHNDVLICMTGSGTQAPNSIVGRVAKHRGNNSDFLINQRVGRFQITNSQKLDSDFLYYFLNPKERQWDFVAIATGSANQVNISGRQIESIEICLPPLTEQKAIAHILGSLDDKIELNRRMNETLEAMAQALFKSWFIDFDPVIDNILLNNRNQNQPSPPAPLPEVEGSLTDWDNERIFDGIPDELRKRAEIRRGILAKNQKGEARRVKGENDPDSSPFTLYHSHFPSEFEHTEEMGWIPKGWRAGSLDDMVVLQRGFDLPKSKRTDGVFPLIAASGQDGTHNEAKVSGPGVVTGRSGKLGIVTFVNDDFWPLNTTLWVKEYKRSSPYHSYFLLCTLGLERFNAGSAVPTLNRNHIHGMKLVVPAKPVLAEFSNVAESFFNRRFSNLKHISELSKTRDTLLPQLLSGEIRIPEAEKLVEHLEKNGGGNGKS